MVRIGTERGTFVATWTAASSVARYTGPTIAPSNFSLSSGRRYLYLGVPPEIAEEFAAAESKGGYFNRVIRGRFDCHPLRDAELPRRAVND